MHDTSQTQMQELLRDSYGLTAPEITLIRTGDDGNQTFKVIANETPFIVRIYGDQGQQHPDWARYELELLAHLASSGLAVAGPVAARNGAWMQFLPRDSTPPAPVALFTFAEGGVEWPTSIPRSHCLGAAFAQLHQVADGFRTTAAARALDLECLLHAPLRRMQVYLDDADPQDRATWDTLSQTAAHAAALLAAVPDMGSAIGPIHGDLHQGNCHFNGTDSADGLTFFDFSNAAVGWRVYDLSGFLWPLRDDTIRDPAIQAACEAFLDGYRSVRQLLPEEQNAIPASVKARDFWEAGGWLEFGQNLNPETVRDGLRSMADQFRQFPSP